MLPVQGAWVQFLVSQGTKIPYATLPLFLVKHNTRNLPTCTSNSHRFPEDLLTNTSLRHTLSPGWESQAAEVPPPQGASEASQVEGFVSCP